MEKLETQNAASCDQRRKLGVVVKKNFKFIEKVENQKKQAAFVAKVSAASPKQKLFLYIISL